MGLIQLKKSNTYLSLKIEEAIAWNSFNNIKSHNISLMINNGVMRVMLNETLQYIESLEQSKNKLDKIKEIL